MNSNSHSIAMPSIATIFKYVQYVLVADADADADHDFIHTSVSLSAELFFLFFHFSNEMRNLQQTLISTIDMEVFTHTHKHSHIFTFSSIFIYTFQKKSNVEKKQQHQVDAIVIKT